MPSCFFQASATYFALDESCNMLYLRLTGSTTLKPKGRCSVVQKPGSSRGFAGSSHGHGGERSGSQPVWVDG